LGLGSHVVYSQDFVGGNGQDAYGHGQHVAGIIASNGASSNCLQCTRSFVGMAPGAKLPNFRVLDANGGGTDNSVIAAIERAIALKAKYNIRVMNLSLGRPVFESYKQDPLCQAVEAAWKAGIVVVVAAGNDGRDNSFENEGYGTIMAPGNDPYVMALRVVNPGVIYRNSKPKASTFCSEVISVCT
jgi:serine protease AprX